jgi:hypothetical protein
VDGPAPYWFGEPSTDFPRVVFTRKYYGAAVPHSRQADRIALGTLQSEGEETKKPNGTEQVHLLESTQPVTQCQTQHASCRFGLRGSYCPARFTLLGAAIGFGFTWLREAMEARPREGLPHPELRHRDTSAMIEPNPDSRA